MSCIRVQRWSVVLIGLFMLPTAIQATVAPGSWFDDFPLGRGSLVSIPSLAALSSWAGLRPRNAS